MVRRRSRVVRAALPQDAAPRPARCRAGCGSWGVEAEPGGGFGEGALVARCAVVGGVDELVEQTDQHAGRVAFLGAEEDVVDPVGAGPPRPALAEYVFALRPGAVAEPDRDVHLSGERQANLSEPGPECLDRPVQPRLAG